MMTLVRSCVLARDVDENV